MRQLITLLLVLLSTIGYSQENDTLSYYKEICFKREFQSDLTMPLRFYKDIKIYANGDINDELRNELHKIVSELDELIQTVNISIVDSLKNSNVHIYLGGVNDFIKQLKTSKKDKKYKKGRLEDNWGYFWISHCSKNNINYSRVFVDTERTSTDEERKHLLREELTQSLGLPNDSNKYPKSIFYSNWVEDTTEYTDMDKAIIKRHYSFN